MTSTNDLTATNVLQRLTTPSPRTSLPFPVAHSTGSQRTVWRASAPETSPALPFGKTQRVTVLWAWRRVLHASFRNQYKMSQSNKTADREAGSMFQTSWGYTIWGSVSRSSLVVPIQLLTLCQGVPTCSPVSFCGCLYTHSHMSPVGELLPWPRPQRRPDAP